MVRRRDPRRLAIAEVMWRWDFVGVLEDKEHTPNEYDSLVDRACSILGNGGTAEEATAGLREVLRRDWSLVVSANDAKTLAGELDEAWKGVSKLDGHPST
jgi:hypothetical protein